MGNTNAKPHPKPRSKKQLRWKAADRPSPPGKPSLLQANGLIPDIIQIQWLKPDKDGGSPVTAYLVEHRKLGTTHWAKSSTLPVSTTELAVSGLEPGWRYQFRVRAENAVGLSDPSEISDPLIATLQRSAIAAPKFTQELQDLVKLEDEKAEFEVHFLGQPPPNICWFKNGYEIFSGNRTRITTIPEKSTLTIIRCSATDEGEIKCTATNRAGHVATKAKLTIEAPPVIRLPRSYQEQDGIIFEIGETIKFSIAVSGRPLPLIFWSHDGESLLNDDRHEIDFVDKTATVKIENALRTDRGEYQIKAVNKLGQDMASFLVTITDKPTPPGKARVLLTSGKSVTLSWSTPQDDGGCKIGKYIIEYYRIGWDVWLKAATSRQQTTMLGDLIEGSQYKFRVKAESPYGVSDPGEESETVFIPDFKRGISNDVTEALSLEIPMKRRDSASPRVTFAVTDDTPIRPQRKKTGKTPEASPRMKRRTLVPSPDKGSKFSRRFSLPSTDRLLPVITTSKQGEPNFYPNGKVFPSSPTELTSVKSQPNKSDSPSPEIIITDVDEEANSKPNKNNLISNEVFMERPKYEEDKMRVRPPLTRQEFSGSSEFMLVLCPEEEQGEQFRKLGISFDESSVPPPLSLSAPELGVEPPEQVRLKRSSSSTELLNFRLMERLQQNDDNKTERTKQISPIEKQQDFASPKVVDEEWMRDYEESIPSEGESSSEDLEYGYDEEETYSPRGRSITTIQSNENKPFEILTVRKEPPSSDIVPKPILKKKTPLELPTDDPVLSRSRSHSLVEAKLPPLILNTKEQRNRSNSLVITEDEPLDINQIKKSPSLLKRRSFSLIPNQANAIRELFKNKDKTEVSTPPSPASPKPVLNVSALANFTSIAGAGVVIPGKLINKKESEDEAKVVVDFYGDIVKSFGGKTRPSAEFSRTTSSKYDTFEERKISEIKSDVGPPSRYQESDQSVPRMEVSRKVTPLDGRVPSPTIEKHQQDKFESPFKLTSKYDTYEERKISEIKSNMSSQHRYQETDQTILRMETPRKVTPFDGKLSPSTIEKHQQNKFEAPFRPIVNNSKPPRTFNKSPSPQVSSYIPNIKPEPRNRGKPRSRDASTSPVRFDIINSRSSSRNSLERDFYSRSSSRASSLTREITTQTSIQIEPKTPIDVLKKRTELAKKAEKRVKSIFEYFTDLAMLSVATWFYLFHNEYLSIPFLIILVYRQLSEKMTEMKNGVKKWIPKWIMKRFEKK